MHPSESKRSHLAERRLARATRAKRNCLCHRQVAVAAAVLCAAAAVPAWAQTLSAPPEQVVITASGVERRLFDTPYAVGTVDAEQLRAAGAMVNLSEALSRVPGLVVANRSNYAQDLQISSRGFGARASFGVRGMRLYADGIPASGPDGQGQVSHFDLAGAQRVEVLRGPFTALYGSSSGGVITLVGRAATERRVGLDADLGSDGLMQVRLGVDAPLGGGWNLRAQAGQFSVDGFRPQASAERTLANVRLGWDGPRDRVVIVLNTLDQPALDPLGLTRAQFEQNPDQTTSVALPQAAPGLPGFNTRKNTAQTQAGVNWRHRFEGDGPLKETQLAAFTGRRAVTQWQAITVAAQTSSVRQPGGVIDFDRGYRGVDARAVWRFALPGERALQLVAGLSQEASDEDRRGYENFTGSGASQLLGVTGRLRRDERNRVDSRDTYAQAELDLAPRWTATLGVRDGQVRFRSEDRYIVGANGDDSGSVSYGYTNPVAALQWRLRDDLQVYLSAARGFESPTFGELAYRPDGLGGFNLTLRPQTSRQWELGAKWRGAAGLSVDAAVFDARTEDEIGVATNQGGRQTFRNVGRTQRRGLELDLRWRLSPAWRAQLAATWLDATYVDGFAVCAAVPCATPTLPVAPGNRIAGTLDRSAYAELAWTPRAGWDLALEARGQGRQPVNDLNNDFAGGFGLLAARVMHSMPAGEGRLELLARVDNLADRRVAGSVIVNEGNSRFFEPAPGRTLLLSARWVRGF